MRFGLIVLMTLMALGCSPEDARRLPTTPGSPSPTPAPNSLGNVTGAVVDSGGLCIDGATVQIVRGQASSQSITQRAPCDPWSAAGGASGLGI